MQYSQKEPKLKDSIYGEMVWNEWDEDEAVWFSRMKDAHGHEFMLFVHADSQTDFFAPRQTHKLYKKIIDELPQIRRRAINYTLKNIENFQEKKSRNHIGDYIEQSAKLFSIEFWEDLVSEVCFSWKLKDEEDSMLIAIVDADGNFAESYLNEA